MKNVVADFLDLACCVTRHYHGCALLNRGPGQRLYRWALS